MEKSFAYDLSYSELISLVSKWGEPGYRAKQIWHGLYQNFWNTPEEFYILPSELRKRLSESIEFTLLKPVKTLKSSGGDTNKTLFELDDRNAIETVLMKYETDSESDQAQPENTGQGRRTVCISTQVGCAMGCVFCATGQIGFKRNLSCGEIVAQVMYYERLLHDQDERVTNVVLMGMGEPFHNYENVMTAIEQLNDSRGYNLGARRITVSTVGLIPYIKRFIEEKRQFNLAVSLHAANDELRNILVPLNNRYPIDDLLTVCRDYIKATNRRISFEWALIKDVNDTQSQARLLTRKIKGLLCHVNIIILNPTEKYRNLPATQKSAENIKRILIESGIPCTIRLRRGVDILAGCGQLAGTQTPK